MHLKQNKLTEQEQEEEKKFEKLLKDINDVLFYLSNIEFQRHQDLGIQCELTQPIEIVLSLTDVYKFREDLEKEYEQVRVESEGNDIKRTSSIDYVVIDDPQDPD